MSSREFRHSLEFARELVSCSFGWVRRESKSASHSLRKWGLSACFWGLLVPCYFPPSALSGGFEKKTLFLSVYL